MRILIYSDLHLEQAGGAPIRTPKDLDFDVVVLAGDISTPGSAAIRWALRDTTFAGRPAIFVAGNHEFYGREMSAELEEMRKTADGRTVHFLNRQSVVLGGVRFLGCTLWTDFSLPIRQPEGHDAANVEVALKVANQRLNDFRVIQCTGRAIRAYRGGAPHRQLLSAEHTLALHHIDRDWLRRALNTPFEGPTVVVTHHAPSMGSVAPKYAQDILTAAFVSDLPHSLLSKASLWVHGHTHTHFDYEVAGCRVVSNPRGYRCADGAFENVRFDAGWVVQV